MLPNPDAHPTFKFGKTMCCNPTTPATDYKNKWKNIGLMDVYYVVGITAISYLGFGVIINMIVSKEDIIYCVTIGDIPHCTCPDLQKCPLMHWKRKGNKCIANIFIMWLDFCARWITRVTSSFMHLHIPTMRSCDYLNLLVLESASNITSVLLSRMYKNVNKWYVLAWIVIIKISNELKVFQMIYGNTPPSNPAPFKMFQIYNWKYTINVVLYLVYEP